MAVWVEAVVASPCSSRVFCRTTTRGTCLCCVAGSRIWRAPSSCSWKNWDLWGRLTWTPGPSLTSDPYTASHWTCTTMSPAFQSKTPTVFVFFTKYFESLLMHLHVSLPWWWNAAAPFSIHLRIWWCFWTIALESQSWYKGLNTLQAVNYTMFIPTVDVTSTLFYMNDIEKRQWFTQKHFLWHFWLCVFKFISQQWTVKDSLWRI